MAISRMASVGTPVSPDEKVAVLAQLELIIASPAFRNSKRYPSFLRHVVERSLAGETGELKERMLGVEVFGRAADYDTNADPIVRVTAGEVRNRIARYYHNPGHEAEIRIELPSGSYIPEFQFPPPAAAAESAPAPRSKKSPWRLAFTALLAAGWLVAAFIWWRPWAHFGSYERFWRPFVNADSTVTICLARTLNGRDIGWPDVSAAVNIASLVEKEGGRYQLRRDDAVSFEDLSRAPAILIGAFNDVWTIRLSENLRFEPRQEGSLRWILDRNNPNSRAWSREAVAPGSLPSGSTHDYAVISRLIRARSDQPTLTIAGLSGYGTGVAGELASERSFPDLVAGKAPPGWEKKNLQVVIETEIIDNHTGPPRILAVHVW